MSTLLPLSRGAVGGVLATASGTTTMGGGDLSVWSVRGEFGVCREWGELGVSAVWGSGDGGNGGATLCGRRVKTSLQGPGQFNSHCEIHH